MLLKESHFFISFPNLQIPDKARQRSAEQDAPTPMALAISPKAVRITGPDFAGATKPRAERACKVEAFH